MPQSILLVYLRHICMQIMSFLYFFSKHLATLEPISQLDSHLKNSFPHRNMWYQTNCLQLITGFAQSSGVLNKMPKSLLKFKILRALSDVRKSGPEQNTKFVTLVSTSKDITEIVSPLCLLFTKLSWKWNVCCIDAILCSEHYQILDGVNLSWIGLEAANLIWLFKNNTRQIMSRWTTFPASRKSLLMFLAKLSEEFLSSES